MEKPERTVDDRLFPSAESRREEWNRLKPFFDEITSNGEEYITRGRLDALAATEFFQVAVRYMQGGGKMPEPVRKFSCKYNPKKTLVCTDKNCPEKLGGIDYRTIFGVACPFRKAR